MMYNRSKILALAVLILIPFGFLVSQIPQTEIEEIENPKFIISSWDYPDEYGQGIWTFLMYENSTGSWETDLDFIYFNESTTYEWNASVGIQLHCYSMLNSSFLGLDNNITGKNYLRHNVIVTQTNGTTVFSQQNFTFVSVSIALDPLWLYHYYVTLNFIPVGGEIYTVTVIYEVYYQ